METLRKLAVRDWKSGSHLHLLHKSEYKEGSWHSPDSEFSSQELRERDSQHLFPQLSPRGYWCKSQRIKIALEV